MKTLFKGLFVTLCCLFGVILLTAGLLFGIIYSKYDINLITFFSEIRHLNEKVNVNNLVTNPYSDDDIESIIEQTNEKVENLFSYDKNNGFIVSTENITIKDLSNPVLKFSDTQLAAVADNIIDNREDITIKMGKDIKLKELGFELLQIDFEYLENNKTSFNVVFKIESAFIKNKLTTFPLNFGKKIIPDEFYISSTINIHKNEDKFSYTTEGTKLLLNNLTKAETDDMFNTFNKLAKTGTSLQFANKITSTVVDVLIGNENNDGFIYSLKKYGADDFAFTKIDNIDYLTVNFMTFDNL